jgi:hypothetical protein
MTLLKYRQTNRRYIKRQQAYEKMAQSHQENAN